LPVGGEDTQIRNINGAVEIRVAAEGVTDEGVGGVDAEGPATRNADLRAKAVADAVFEWSGVGQGRVDRASGGTIPEAAIATSDDPGAQVGLGWDVGGGAEEHRAACQIDH